MPVLQSLLFNHIIPSIFNAAATLLLVLAIFKIFRIKNPATRFMFLFLPLLKPFIVLLDNASTAVHINTDKPMQIGLRMPDPLGLVVSPWQEAFNLAYDNSVVATVVFLAMIVIFALLARRWTQLFLFLSSFKDDTEVDRATYPQLYEVLDRLVSEFGVKYPKLVFTRNTHIVPFSVGYKMPIIVLSEDLANSFPAQQLEIMLAHELAHIQRKDSLLSWIAIILRDFLFFNPLVHPAYRKLEEEKEKTCDTIAAEKTGASPKDVAETLIDVAIFYKTRPAQPKALHPAFSKGFLFRESTLKLRVDALTGPESRQTPLKRRTLLEIFAFVILLYVQPFLMINLDAYQLFLR